MAYMIRQSRCTGCSACQNECPNDAIFEKSFAFFIDPEKCTECIGFFAEQQCAAICPMPKTCIVNPDVPRFQAAVSMKTTDVVNAILTPAAERFMRRMVRLGTNPNSGFQLRVSLGGCSGIAVEFDVTAGPASSDVVWQHAGLSIFLDKNSLPLLDGAIVDFREGAQAGLVVVNPGMRSKACGQVSNLVPVEALLLPQWI